MERGVIPLSDLDGRFDLQATVESGQTYLWDRADDGMYDDDPALGGSAWYETVVPPLETVGNARAVVRVRQVDGRGVLDRRGPDTDSPPPSGRQPRRDSQRSS